ncbi:MAG: carboxyltransferase domain-containing protein [Planctomycetes bacterium]|nr:carboxyltransferase domain-containing protein [Planctomycetota bacterium]
MPPQLQPLGDQAVMAYFPAEAEALSFARTLAASAEDWLLEVVPAYASVAVFYDLASIDYAGAAVRLEQVAWSNSAHKTQPGPLHIIPCCYELGLDNARVAQHTGLSPARIIELHAGAIYTVYALGFCPGFPYLGYLPAELVSVPRLDTPRLRLEKGSVGLTGRQTGIYTEARPGGWNIIGRTPLTLVNVADGYFPLRAGDHVRFRPISEHDFRQLEGKRLEDYDS